jgi:hypothetical protein
MLLLRSLAFPLQGSDFLMMMNRRACIAIITADADGDSSGNHISSIYTRRVPCVYTPPLSLLDVTDKKTPQRSVRQSHRQRESHEAPLLLLSAISVH